MSRIDLGVLRLAVSGSLLVFYSGFLVFFRQQMDASASTVEQRPHRYGEEMDLDITYVMLVAFTTKWTVQVVLLSNQREGW